MHTQDDLNRRILRMLKGTFSLDEAHIIYTFLVWSFFFCINMSILMQNIWVLSLNYIIYKIVLSGGFCQIWDTRNSMIYLCQSLI